MSNFRRNLLIVLTHGLRTDALGDGGAWPLSTPNLEKLANHGVRLVASSACPADPGGMASLLTGQHARQHRHLFQDRGPYQIDGWPRAMKEEGYHLAGVGPVAAFDRWLDDAIEVHPVGSRAYQQCAYLQSTRTKGITAAILQQRKQRERAGLFEPDRLLLEPTDDIDGFIAEQAERMLQRMPTDKPWALVVVFTGPGNDLPPPTIYSEMAPLRELERAFKMADFTTLDAVAELDYPRSMLQRLEPHQLARIRNDYLGRVSLIDFAMGRFSRTLNERSDHSRTWTIFSSDRGQLLGEHGLIGHRSLLCPSIEVPVLIGPPTPAPRRVPIGISSTVDVAATICELASVDPPPGCVGKSLLCLLRGEQFRTRTGGACLAEYSDRLMLETERYKVLFNTQTQEAVAMFDLLNDADENKNLITTAKGRDLLDSMRWRLGDALMAVR